MDRLDAMHLFVRVAELGSFAAVAQQLGLARSVVTRQIAALEAHLGVKLIARSTRRLALTSGGTAYLEKCRVILNLVEAAETGVAEERLTPRGNIRISLPLSYGMKRLAPILLDFSQRYPEVSLDMDFSDRRVNLIEEGIDLSIRITRRLESGDVARKIGTGRMLVVAAPEYLARHVDADNVIANFGQTGATDQTDIAGADNSDLHGYVKESKNKRLACLGARLKPIPPEGCDSN